MGEQMLTTMKKSKKKRGYTLIELMIVIGIIGILALIATLSFTSYHIRACNCTANADAKRAYTAAQGYFLFNAGGTVTQSNLTDYGYTASDDVALTINDDSATNLSMSFRHSRGDRTYTVNATGSITSSP